jgi:hypothetical protein
MEEALAWLAERAHENLGTEIALRCAEAQGWDVAFAVKTWLRPLLAERDAAPHREHEARVRYPEPAFFTEAIAR